NSSLEESTSVAAAIVRECRSSQRILPVAQPFPVESRSSRFTIAYHLVARPTTAQPMGLCNAWPTSSVGLAKRSQRRMPLLLGDTQLESCVTLAPVPAQGQIREFRVDTVHPLFRGEAHVIELEG